MLDLGKGYVSTTSQSEELKRPTQLRLEGDFLKRDGEATLDSLVRWDLAWFP